MRTHKSIKLESTYGLFDTISLFLGIIVGSGIFISAKIVAETTPNGGVSILVWLATGFYSILGALCFAELGTTFPESGGDFAYLRRLCGKKYGDLVAFLRIWVELLILRPGSQAAIAVTVAKYLIVPFLSTQIQNLWVKLESSFGPQGQENSLIQPSTAGPTAHPMVIHAAEVTISIIITIILTIINIFSIKATQFCNALLSGIKIFVLLALAIMGVVCISQVRMLCPIDDENSQYLAHYFECDYKNVTLMSEVAGGLKDSMVAYLSPEILFDFTSWQGFSTVQIMGKISIACYAGMWSYAGWSDVNYAMEEIHNPRRNYPIAAIFSMILVMALYTVIMTGYFAVMQQWEMTSFVDATATLFVLKTFKIPTGEKLAAHISFLNYQQQYNDFNYTTTISTETSIYENYQPDQLLSIRVITVVIAIAVALSACGSLLGSIFASSRLFFVGSRWSHLPTILGGVHVEYKTPMISLILVGALTSLYCFAAFSDNAIDFFINSTCFVYFGSLIICVIGLVV